MTSLWRQTRSFPPAVRLLMANQFAINLAFYMLMPYLAAHLSGDLGLAAWSVGLVLGVRTFSQQGMFLVGGTLADRYGYKAPIMVSCLLRTIGFGLLGWVDNLPTLIAASAATGFMRRPVQPRRARLPRGRSRMNDGWTPSPPSTSTTRRACSSVPSSASRS